MREGGYAQEREQPGWRETDVGSAVVGRTLHKYRRDGGEREGVR